MEQHNYHSSIAAHTTPAVAYANIANVHGWWAKDFTGSAQHVGDTFKVQFGTTWVDFLISEAVPEKKIVWKVTDCYLPWLSDKTEWNGTSVIWEIAPENGNTRIDMTHQGLVPEVECFETCQAGWNRHITGSLFKLITEGKGEPQ